MSSATFSRQRLTKFGNYKHVHILYISAGLGRLNLGGGGLRRYDFWGTDKTTFNYQGMSLNFTWKHEHFHIASDDKRVFCFVDIAWFENSENKPGGNSRWIKSQHHYIHALLSTKYNCMFAAPHTGPFILMGNMQAAVRPAFSMQRSHAGWFVVCCRSS